MAYACIHARATCLFKYDMYSKYKVSYREHRYTAPTQASTSCEIAPRSTSPTFSSGTNKKSRPHALLRPYTTTSISRIGHLRAQQAESNRFTRQHMRTHLSGKTRESLDSAVSPSIHGGMSGVTASGSVPSARPR